MLKILFTALAFWTCLFCAAQPATDANNLAAFVQVKGDSLYKAEKLPGLFVGILNGGQRRFFNFGYAVPDEKLPFDSATVFEAGSITKTLTAYVVESVLQQKGISDSVTILRFLPDSLQANKALASITFLSLLNHTSGLPRLPDNLPLNSNAPYDNYTKDDLFSYLKTCVPKPDGKSNYSNLGVGLAGVLAQRITGKDYKTLLREYVFKPFGMNDARQKKGRKAQGYFDGQKQAFWNMAALAPAGSLQTSADELLNYLKNISLPLRSHQKEVVEKLLQPTVVLSPAMNICRTWLTIEQKSGPTIYWHNGGTYGFSTFAAFVKDTEQCVIVVVNAFNKNAVSDGLGIAIMKKMTSQ